MIVAHVDHGKSTLSSKILTHCYGKKYGIDTLDNLDVEKERGITVRSTYVSFKYGNTIFNLMDTPGHADFKHQLRLLFKYMHCAVLLVDVTQGIQCQTVNNYLEILKAGIPYIIAVSKMDMLDQELAEISILEISEYFKISPNEVVKIDYRDPQTIPNLLNRLKNNKNLAYKITEEQIIILDLFKNLQTGWTFLVHSNKTVAKNDILYIDNKISFKVSEVYRYGNMEVPHNMKNEYILHKINLSRKFRSAISVSKS